MKELIEIQKEISVTKTKHNEFGGFNYRSCEDILVAIKPLLDKHKALLLITDEVKSIGDNMFVEATAVFQVGENSISVKAQAGINLNRKGMDVAQSYGSSSSYARKYALAGMLLLDDNKDADTKDNTKENIPSTEKELEKVKETLIKAHESGDLKKAYFKLPDIQQTELRDFANDLRAS